MRKLTYFFCREKTQQEGSNSEAERKVSPDNDSASTLTLDFLVSRAERDEFMVINYPV
jgi:hypothetical protein